MKMNLQSFEHHSRGAALILQLLPLPLPDRLDALSQPGVAALDFLVSISQPKLNVVDASSDRLLCRFNLMDQRVALELPVRLGASCSRGS